MKRRGFIKIQGCILRRMILSACVLLAVGSAFAQSGATTFKIPFGFIVGPTALPAGEYHISNGPVQGWLILRGDEQHKIFVLANNVEIPSASRQTKVVFHRYGSRYFLSQVWIQGSNLGRELQAGRQEQEVAKQNSSGSMELATVSTQGPR